MCHTAVFLTSRPVLDLRHLSVWTEDIVAHGADIETYTKARLEDSDDVQDILEDQADDMIPAIIANVRIHAAGMFILVIFQVEYICQQTSAREMLEALRTMPSEANTIYFQTLDQIDSQSKSQSRLARKILCWLVLAQASTTLPELLDAIAIESGTPTLDPLNRRSAAILVKVFRGLVVVDNDSVIRLAHLTVWEFLLENLTELPSMRLEVAKACVTYTSFNVFESGPRVSYTDFCTRIDASPFYIYSCLDLSRHLQETAIDECLLTSLSKFANNTGARESYTQIMFSHGRLDRFDLYPRSGVTNLHIAACLVNEELLEALLDTSTDNLDAEDSHGRTLLFWAIDEGHASAVAIFIKHGASLQSRTGDTALNCAARKLQDDIIRVVLEKTITSITERGAKDLFVACITGDELRVEDLVSSGVAIDTRDSDRGPVTVGMLVWTPRCRRKACPRWCRY